MTTTIKEQKEKAPCGCGRSPTDYCVGWHELTPEEYEAITKEEKEDLIRKG
jgi:CDGSH-type Zn-finger protein